MSRRARPTTTTRDTQLVLLADPLAWAHEAWNAIIGSGPLDMVFMAERPTTTWANRGEAFAQIALAASAPGTDVDIDGFVGRAEAAANNLGCHQHGLGMELGAVLEQLRQGLLACVASAERPIWFDAEDAKSLAERRAKLEAVVAPIAAGAAADAAD